MSGENDHSHEMDPLRPHAHDNNPRPPDEETAIRVIDPAGTTANFEVADLANGFSQAVIEAYAYATDHGRHGPYRLAGVRLLDVVERVVGKNSAWRQVAVISADGFGNRLDRAELAPTGELPVLLCLRSDGRPLARAHGLVRLVVPSERNNALRQVKWVREIRVLA